MTVQIRRKAWSFLTLERAARLGAAEHAYADELGVRYAYDSRVAHHAYVQSRHWDVGPLVDTARHGEIRGRGSD
jgi:hypothetical protein